MELDGILLLILSVDLRFYQLGMVGSFVLSNERLDFTPYFAVGLNYTRNTSNVLVQIH